MKKGTGLGDFWGEAGTDGVQPAEAELPIACIGRSKIPQSTTEDS